MSTSVHITRINDTWANVLSDLDDHQTAIAVTGVNASAADTDVPFHAHRDSTNFYVPAIGKHWTGAAWSYHDTEFNDAYFYGDTHTAEYQYHKDDSDTYRRFQADRITDAAGGVTMWDYVEDTVSYGEFNPNDADVDFIINTTTPDTIFVQGSSGTVGLGVSTLDAWAAGYNAVQNYSGGWM